MRVFPAMVQGSEEWMRIRAGRPTSSRFSDIVTAKKGELSKSAGAYIHELIADCFVTDAAPGFIGTAWTDRGLDNEGEARKAFSEHTGLEVAQVGFITRDDGVVGCSPDGMVVDLETLEYVAGLELKNPAPKTHVATVAAGVLPDIHKQQVHGGMVVTGLNQWHFFSHCPGMKPFHLIVERDDYTKRLGETIDEFLVLYGAARDTLIPRLKLALNRDSPTSQNNITTTTSP